MSGPYPLILVLPTSTSLHEELSTFLDVAAIQVATHSREPSSSPFLTTEESASAFEIGMSSVVRYLTPSMWPSRESFSHFVSNRMPKIDGQIRHSGETTDTNATELQKLLAEFLLVGTNLATHSITDESISSASAIVSHLLAVESPSSVFAVADGLDFKPTERCWVARALPIDNLLCSGRTISEGFTQDADYLSDIATILRERRNAKGLGAPYTVLVRPSSGAAQVLAAVEEALCHQQRGSDTIKSPSGKGVLDSVLATIRSASQSNLSFAIYAPSSSSSSGIPSALFLTPSSVDSILSAVEEGGGALLKSGDTDLAKKVLERAGVLRVGGKVMGAEEPPIVEQSELSTYFMYLLSGLDTKGKPEGLARLATHIHTSVLGTLAAQNDVSQYRSSIVRQRCHARVGLVGNPSDNFHGKCLSLTIKNFWVDVCLLPTPCDSATQLRSPLRLIPNPFSDQTNFQSFSDLHSNSSREGYSGGLRLIQATCKKIFEYVLGAAADDSRECFGANKGRPFSFNQRTSAQRLLTTMQKDTFSLAYHTNIPRQVGLAGSSCIVVAVLKALCRCYRIVVSEQDEEESENQFSIPKSVLPSIALSVESQELGITAGLQDRAAQVFEGLVAMDFSKPHLESTGCGIYKAFSGVNSEEVDEEAKDSDSSPALLPPMFLAVARDPSDSGKMHANVKQRYDQGDAEVVAAARRWAGFADGSLAALGLNWHGNAPSPSTPDYEAFCGYIDANCRLRRELYTDPCLGKKNLEMIAIANSHGAAAKFPGSGGAILVVPRDGSDMAALQKAMEAKGYFLIQIRPHFP